MKEKINEAFIKSGYNDEIIYNLFIQEKNLLNVIVLYSSPRYNLISSITILRSSLAYFFLINPKGLHTKLLVTNGRDWTYI